MIYNELLNDDLSSISPV